jgi:predicted RNase H-like HicB family nuclease
MLQNYISNALNHAKYEILPESNSVYGEITVCPGVYAKAPTFEECRNELIEVLEGWLILRLRKNLEIPIIENVSLDILETADAAN